MHSGGCAGACAKRLVSVCKRGRGACGPEGRPLRSSSRMELSGRSRALQHSSRGWHPLARSFLGRARLLQATPPTPVPPVSRRPLTPRAPGSALLLHQPAARDGLIRPLAVRVGCASVRRSRFPAFRRRRVRVLGTVRVRVPQRDPCPSARGGALRHAPLPGHHGQFQEPRLGLRRYRSGRHQGRRPRACTGACDRFCRLLGVHVGGSGSVRAGVRGQAQGRPGGQPFPKLGRARSQGHDGQEHQALPAAAVTGRHTLPRARAADVLSAPGLRHACRGVQAPPVPPVDRQAGRARPGAWDLPRLEAFAAQAVQAGDRHGRQARPRRLGRFSRRLGGGATPGRRHVLVPRRGRGIRRRHVHPVSLYRSTTPRRRSQVRPPALRPRHFVLPHARLRPQARLREVLRRPVQLC